MGPNYNRKNKIKPFLQEFNFENINYPLKKEDYEKFEQNNSNIALIVQRPHNNEVVDHFRSTFIEQRQQILCLLLLNNNRYAYVTRLIHSGDYKN